jgi:hypothetical protein
MIRRTVILTLMLALAALALGCAPRWQVVRQANPNPLWNQTTFAVLPVDYGGLLVGEKSEAEYLAAKDEKQRESFAGDKAGLNEEFAAALIAYAGKSGIRIELATGPATAPFMIRPHVRFIEPGWYAPIAPGASRVAMALTILNADGKVVDEIALEHGTSPNSGVSIGGINLPGKAASGSRLRSDGKGLGELVAHYLTFRVKGVEVD